MFRPLPPNPKLTLVLLALWAILAIYIIWTRNTLGYIMLALVALFVFLPALVVWLAARGAHQDVHGGTPPEPAGDAAPTTETDSNGSR